jgi:3-hydroxyisobutyrate dehydrogenase
LSIFVGGDAADVERARPVLAAMGTTITHLGSIGSGQAAKAVNQVILAGGYLGVAEGIVLALKAGLDVEALVAALSGGAAQSWVLANRSGRMLANDYPLGFKVALPPEGPRSPSSWPAKRARPPITASSRRSRPA